MKNAPSFLGYSQLSAEITAGAVDHREQIDRKHLFPINDRTAKTTPMDRTNMKHQLREHNYKKEKKKCPG